MSALLGSGLERSNSSQETSCKEPALDASTVMHGQARSEAAGEPSTQAGYRFDPFRCRRCDEPIGVYEPLAVAGEEGIRITSRAAEPELDGDEAIYFHRDCFESDAAAAEISRRRSAWPSA